METRKIEITLEEARKWYNDSDKRLVPIALRAFKREELAAIDYESIKTFEQALHALYPTNSYMRETITTNIYSISSISRSTAAMLKLKVVRKALNLDTNLAFYTNNETSDSGIYCPNIQLLDNGCSWYEIPQDSEKLSRIKIEKNIYNVFGKVVRVGSGGLSGICEKGTSLIVNANRSLLGCATPKIAEHLMRYFSTLIIEAIYGDIITSYEILDNYGGNK